MKRGIKQIEGAQRRATGIVVELKGQEYGEKLTDKLRITDHII